MSLPKLLTAAEAAEVLRMTVWEVRRKIGAGELRATKPARCWLISEDDIRAYLAAHSNTEDVA